MNRRATIVFRQRDKWLLECLEKIVETKKLAGMKSSISFELVRLAKNGLTGEMTGAKMDRIILKEKETTDV